MTPREKEALDFIKSYIVRQGYSPSYDEIAENLGLKSKSGVNRIVVSLEEQGYIRRNHAGHDFKARCIEVVGSNLKDAKRVVLAAQGVMDNIIKEDIDDATGEGTVVIDAKALGDLDVALKEATGA